MRQCVCFIIAQYGRVFSCGNLSFFHAAICLYVIAHNGCILQRQCIFMVCRSVGLYAWYKATYPLIPVTEYHKNPRPSRKSFYCLEHVPRSSKRFRCPEYAPSEYSPEPGGNFFFAAGKNFLLRRSGNCGRIRG